MSLEIRNMGASLGGQAVLHAASVTVTKGRLTGLIGANGAGKTTLLRAAAGLLPEADGDVLIDDTPSTNLSPRLRARRLAYLPQGQGIDWALPVRDVIALGRHPFQGPFGRLSEKDHQIVDDIMARLSLSRFATRPVTDLSGGERALVLLGRALAVGAPYLLADEPTASLDPARQLEVMELLKAEAVSGKGVLIVLHDLALATRFLDDAIVMDRGRIIAAGPVAEVMTPDILKAAYGITPLMGEEDGERWLVPWRRAPAAPEA